jgi:hypothetical protein
VGACRVALSCPAVLAGSAVQPGPTWRDVSSARGIARGSRPTSTALGRDVLVVSSTARLVTVAGGGLIRLVRRPPPPRHGHRNRPRGSAERDGTPRVACRRGVGSRWRSERRRAAGGLLPSLRGRRERRGTARRFRACRRCEWRWAVCRFWACRRCEWRWAVCGFSACRRGEWCRAACRLRACGRRERRRAVRRLWPSLRRRGEPRRSVHRLRPPGRGQRGRATDGLRPTGRRRRRCERRRAPGPLRPTGCGRRRTARRVEPGSCRAARRVGPGGGRAGWRTGGGGCRAARSTGGGGCGAARCTGGGGCRAARSTGGGGCGAARRTGRGGCRAARPTESAGSRRVDPGARSGGRVRRTRCGRRPARDTGRRERRLRTCLRHAAGGRLRTRLRHAARGRRCGRRHRRRERGPGRGQRDVGRRRRAVRHRRATVPGCAVAVAGTVGLHRREAALVAVPHPATVGRTVEGPPGPQRHHLGVAGQRRMDGIGPLRAGVLLRRLVRGLPSRIARASRVTRHRTAVLIGLPLRRRGHPVHRPEAGKTARLAGVVGAGRRLHRIKTPVERRRDPPVQHARRVAGAAPGQARRTDDRTALRPSTHPLCVVRARIVGCPQAAPTRHATAQQCLGART